jgi:hypothetical protein
MGGQAPARIGMSLPSGKLMHISDADARGRTPPLAHMLAKNASRTHCRANLAAF